MKKHLLLCCALLCLALPAEAQYSDASLNGPWIIVISGVETYDYAVYLVFDGLGSITDMGSFNAPPGSAGSYTVAPGGSISGLIWSDGYVSLAGQMLTATTAELYSGPLTMPLLKVVNPGACAGGWRGSFAQDGTAATHDVEMTISPTGEIESCTDFAPPVTGKFFYQSGYLAGHFTTGESEPGWEEIMLQEATMVGETMSGDFGLDCTSCSGGSFQLTFWISNVESSAAPALTLRQNRPNPFNPRTTIEYDLPGAGPVRLAVFDLAGRLIRTLVEESMPQGSHQAVWDGRDSSSRDVGSGTYIARLESSGRVGTLGMVLVR
jgi:hypothetical protein